MDQSMGEHEPTVVDRELGLRIRAAMKSAGLVMSDVAERMGCATSRVSRQLSGRQRMSIADVATMLTICGWTTARQQSLLRLCEDSGTRDVVWLEPVQVCASLQSLTQRVTRAVHVAPMMLPWTVQTDGYARAVGVETGAPSELLTGWASIRNAWHRRWRDGSLVTTVFLHELALRPVVGGQAVMAAQLAELDRLSRLPSMSVRVLPAETAVHVAIKGGFTLLEFDRWRPLVYQDQGNAGLLVGTADAIDTAQHVVSRLAAMTPPGNLQDRVGASRSVA